MANRLHGLEAGLLQILQFLDIEKTSNGLKTCQREVRPVVDISSTVYPLFYDLNF